MHKTKKTDKKLALNKTTLRRMDLAAVSGGVLADDGDITTFACTLTCGCHTGYTGAQKCCFTC